MKNYSEISILLHENRLKKEEIINSDIYNFLVNNNYKVFIKFWESMSNKNNYRTIRLRSDSFLKEAINSNNSFLIAGLNINNHKKLFIFKSDVWHKYLQSTDSSNSIITIDYYKLIDLYSNNFSGISTKKSKINDKMVFTDFYVTNLDNFDEEYFSEFINLNSVNYSSENNRQVLDPSIPKKYKNIIDELYGFECSIRYFCEKNCRCKLSKPFESWDTQKHHIIPKEYFKKCEDFINWDIVHNPINIIPICYYCHKEIHSKIYDKVNAKLNSIMDIYKKNGKYDIFINYLQKNTKLKNEKDLLDFYLK